VLDGPSLQEVVVEIDEERVEELAPGEPIDDAEDGDRWKSRQDELERLAAAVPEAEDPRLRGALAAVALRVRIELARRA
jgi:uncharacterized protein (UPF0216 family)